ncbi:MAG: hypothetical protein IJB96_11175, partial [Lachnospira sp.]|nr:hypothetical protein [Lachnospira sp.]
MGYGFWEKCTQAAFDEGVYRFKLSMNSFALSDGSYYALSPSTTTLTLNGTAFTAGTLYESYERDGQGTLVFYSPQYTVAKTEGTHLVTVTTGSNGLASADKVYGKRGDVVTLTAQPYDGYRLKEWRVLSGGVTVENNQFTIGSEDVEIKAIFESTNENLGNITRVEVTLQEGKDYRPVMGRTAELILATVRSSTPNDDTLGIVNNIGMWEVKQPDGSWENFVNKPFTYGTYRMWISIDSNVVDGKYCAITKDTVLIVDGVEWTVDPSSYVYYYDTPNGRGAITFVSEEMEVIPSLDVYDGTYIGCHVEPIWGEFGEPEEGWTVPRGDNFSFTIEPDDHYELTDSDVLKVYVNDVLVTSDEDGVYTVPTAGTHGLNIYVEGDAFTGYSNLNISANGKTVTEKVYVGDTYTFKTLAEFGATVPSGSTFTGWKIGGKTYQPGDTYTVVGTGDINVNAAFTGLYNITVENGKAYADEAHTLPILAATENTVIYVVADPAPGGKVFSYWNKTFATVGGHGWFDNSESAETTFTVYDSDVVLAPVYETLVDKIVINGMTKPAAGVAIDNSDYSYKWGCNVPADSGYSLGISYWYDITDGEPEFAMSDGEVFQIGHKYRFKARVHLYGDTVLPVNVEDISVSLGGIDTEDYQCTINEIGYTSVTIYFEFTCEREMPDTAYIRPAGDGMQGNSFQITNIGELYWFAAFVNEKITAPDLTVDPAAAHAKLMNDITVNPDLLMDDYALNVSEEDTSLLAEWELINNYEGIFDGQNHTISGIYCVPPVTDTSYHGFFGYLADGSCVRNLTLAESYFCAPAKDGADMGGLAGRVAYDSMVENCHFDGTVTTVITGDSEDRDDYKNVEIAGIAGYVSGEIRNCTTRGLILGYGYRVGGIAADVRYGDVIGCVNEATVENTMNDTGYYYTGGIVGHLYKGTIQDCYNKGNVSSGWLPVGIVCDVEDAASTVIRCWNEGEVSKGAGIVGRLKGTIQNCYNVGTVRYGIVSMAYYNSSVTYCHNVGEITSYGSPICDYAGTNAEIASCYYLADSELDELDGTTYKTATEFADGIVLALLNSGDNDGNWEQGEDDDYPVLGEIPGITVSGTITSFESDTDDITIELFAEGSETADYTVTVKGNTAEYVIEDVEFGTYTMKVSKKGHATKECSVVADGDDVALDVTLWLYGDGNHDGLVDVKDAVLIKKHLASMTVEMDEDVMDVNADSVVDIKDAVKLMKKLAGMDVELGES